uniref:C2H2-type domain-containing protein n=1 Tax=Ditylenchus dipsaci TaxID=166011 RepID=A0A915CZL0_9BILA
MSDTEELQWHDARKKSIYSAANKFEVVRKRIKEWMQKENELKHQLSNTPKDQKASVSIVAAVKSTILNLMWSSLNGFKRSGNTRQIRGNTLYTNWNSISVNNFKINSYSQLNQSNLTSHANAPMNSLSLCCQLCEWQCQEVDDLEDHLCSHHFKYHPLLCDDAKEEMFILPLMLLSNDTMPSTITKLNFIKSTVDSHQRLSICKGISINICGALPSADHCLWIAKKRLLPFFMNNQIAQILLFWLSPLRIQVQVLSPLKIRTRIYMIKKRLRFKVIYSDFVVCKQNQHNIITAKNPLDTEEESHSLESSIANIETVSNLSSAPRSTSFSNDINGALSIGNDGSGTIRYLSLPKVVPMVEYEMFCTKDEHIELSRWN